MKSALRIFFRFKMAYRQVRSGIVGVMLSVVAIGLGVGLVVAVRQMNGVVLESFMETMDAMGGRASLRVVAGEGASFPERVGEEIGEVAGVKLAVPLVSGVAFPDDESGELLTVHGVDVTEDAAVRVYEGVGEENGGGGIVEDPLEFISQADSILLGWEFARERGIEVGDGVDLVTPVGVKGFKVRGLLRARGVGRVLGGRLVVMDLYAAQRVFTGDGYINQVDVLLQDGADVGEVKGRIGEVLPGGLRVEEGWERKGVVRRSVEGFSGMLSGFSLLAVLAGFVIVYNRLGAIFEGRTWQVGLFRTAGVRRGVVVWELVKESMLVGVVGSVLGVVLGQVIGRLALPVLAGTVALNFRVPVVVGEYGVDGWAVVFGLLVGLLASGLAAVVPAMRVAGRRPVAALRWRGRDVVVGGEVRMHWWVRVGVLVVAGVLVLVQRRTGWVWVGNVTTGLVAVGGCLLALPLVVLSARPLGRMLERVFGPEGRFAGAHMRSSPRRAGAGVIILAAGLGAVLLFATLGKSFEESVVESLSNDYLTAIVVASVYKAGGYVEAPIDEGLRDELIRIPGVAVAAGLKQRDWQYAADHVGVVARDEAFFADSQLTKWDIVGKHVAHAEDRVAEGSAVFLSPGLARKLQKRTGQSIVLDTPRGQQRFVIAALVSNSRFAFPDGTIFINRDRYRELWNDATLTQVHVAVEPESDPEVVRAEIARRLGRKYRLRLLSGKQMVGYYAGEVRRAFSLQYVIDLVTLILVLLGVGDAMAAGVFERTGQFGVMRGIGVRRLSLAAVVTLEAVGLCLVGLSVGCMVAMLLGAFWVHVQFPALVGYLIQLHFPYGFWALVGGLALVTCVMGAGLPSLKAARTSVRDSLRLD